MPHKLNFSSSRFHLRVISQAVVECPIGVRESWADGVTRCVEQW